jgi:hypothetical protein
MGAVKKGGVVQEDVSRDQVELGHVTDPSGECRVAVVYGTTSYCKSAWWSAQRYKYKRIVQDVICTEV